MPASPHPDAAIGRALQWLRTTNGLHQQEVLERLAHNGGGVSVVWLSQVENGRRQPGAALVGRLLDVYGCSRAELDELLARRPWDAPAVAESHPSPGVAAYASDVARLVEGYILLPAAAKKDVRDLVRRLNEH